MSYQLHWSLRAWETKVKYEKRRKNFHDSQHRNSTSPIPINSSIFSVCITAIMSNREHFNICIIPKFKRMEITLEYILVHDKQWTAKLRYNRASRCSRRFNRTICFSHLSFPSFFSCSSHESPGHMRPDSYSRFYRSNYALPSSLRSSFFLPEPVSLKRYSNREKYFAISDRSSFPIVVKQNNVRQRKNFPRCSLRPL